MLAVAERAPNTFCELAAELAPEACSSRADTLSSDFRVISSCVRWLAYF